MNKVLVKYWRDGMILHTISIDIIYYEVSISTKQWPATAMTNASLGVVSIHRHLFVEAEQ
jgi:hypothetical protein